MFSDELLNYGWEDTTRRIMSKRTADVEAALGKESLDIDDFGPCIACRLALSGTDGFVEPPLYKAAFR